MGATFGWAADRRAAGAAAGLLLAAAVAAAVAAPLLVYTVTLATFGAAHVLSELRYVDRRFGRRIGPRRVALMAGLLAGVVLARCGNVLGFIAPAEAVTLELSLVVLLALSAAHGSAGRVALALALASAIGVATLLAPFDTAVSLAILHNLTPLAFLWEIAPPGARRRVMAAASAALLGAPLLVATGLPRAAMEAAGLMPMSLDPLGAGPLGHHLWVYVPAPFLAGTSAVDLFSASVVAQCGHYAAVIVLLPALLARKSPSARGILPWPGGGLFATLAALVSAVMLWRFTQGFVPARALYGIAASIHAWIEVPLIVIALTAGQARTRPRPADAPLATAETASARPAGI